MEVDEFFAGRRRETEAFLERWKASFEQHLGADGRELLAKQKCVYAVGSAGRGERGERSDLDVFAVTLEPSTKMDEVLIQAAVIRAMRAHGLPEPSRDGRFLQLYSSEAVKRQLGRPNDDPDNTFTVRMLLLLESRPLSGSEAYERLVNVMVDAYWRNDEAHGADYLPMVLVNDVVRYWRVLLLNYEADHAEKERVAKSSGDPAQLSYALAKKRLASQKLRFSRALTCYSMIARLLHLTRQKTSEPVHIERGDVIEIVRQTPVERLQYVRDNGGAEVAGKIGQLLTLYRRHLELRDESEERLVETFSGAARKQHVDDSKAFGEALFQLLQALGKDSPLYRYVVV